jgi:hypothetical protein
MIPLHHDPFEVAQKPCPKKKRTEPLSKTKTKLRQKEVEEGEERNSKFITIVYTIFFFNHYIN